MQHPPKGFVLEAGRTTKRRRAGRHGLPKRERAKRRRRIKRRFNLTRRESGAIGAGHLEAPMLLGAVLHSLGFRPPGARH